MPLLVVGSIAFDTVQTPVATREDLLGGAAVYFSYAASFYTSVRLVGVVGDDWPDAYTDMLQRRGIDTAGLHVVEGGETFRWRGKYLSNMNDRETLEVHLNVFGDFSPTLPEDYRSCPYVFLANGSPRLQLKVLEQMHKPKLAVADTMDLWIREEHDALRALLQRLDGLVLNDAEAKLLTGEENLVEAGREVLKMGPDFVVVKKGEHGAMFFSAEDTYVLPAYPTQRVVDPTGAGDTFAGGMMGAIAEERSLDPATLKLAMAHGILMASYTVEDFSLDRLREIDRAALKERMHDFRRMLSF